MVHRPPENKVAQQHREKLYHHHQYPDRHFAEPTFRQRYPHAANQNIRTQGENQPRSGFPRFQSRINNPVFLSQVMHDVNAPTSIILIMNLNPHTHITSFMNPDII